MVETAIPGHSAELLSKARILFGHQSVGQNIVNGIEELAREGKAGRLSIREANGGEGAGATPAFVHFRVGSNGDPASKIESFAKRVDSSAADGLDVAFFKFCYVDVTEGTDVENLFRAYRTAMAELRARHPGVRFVHVTVPLTCVRTGWKDLVKRILGRPGDRERNALRGAYNDLVRREYEGREPLFDLAAVEATRPDGSRATYEFKGKRYDMLARENSDDGEHLGAAGRRVAAARLLAFLAGIL
jgi:hypothetical protein